MDSFEKKLTWEYLDERFLEIFKTRKFRFDNWIEQLELKHGKIAWQKLVNWEDLEDSEILKSFEDIELFAGKLYAITDLSNIKACGPFEIGEDNIFRFALEYYNYFGECFFDGDVIILSLDTKKAWIFHHEGAYAVSKL